MERVAEQFVFVRLHAREGEEKAVEEALREVTAPSREEPGCLSFHLFRSARDPRLFYIHSQWVDEGAFQKHGVLPHTECFLVEYRVKPRDSAEVRRQAHQQHSKLPRAFVKHRVVVTAAHCLPKLPPAHAAAYWQERPYANLLGRLDCGKTKVYAECLFADPVADIAVAAPIAKRSATRTMRTTS
jgi:quinol monooxygenase YgiN